MPQEVAPSAFAVVPATMIARGITGFGFRVVARFITFAFPFTRRLVGLPYWVARLMFVTSAMPLGCLPVDSLIDEPNGLLPLC